MTEKLHATREKLAILTVAGLAIFGAYKAHEKISDLEQITAVERANEAEINKVLETTAESIGASVLKRVLSGGPTQLFSEDKDNPGGYNIFIETKGPNEYYDILVGMEKTDGQLDPATTYEVLVTKRSDDSLDSVEEQAGIFETEDQQGTFWGGNFKQFEGSDSEVPAMEFDAVAAPDSDDFEDAKSISKIAKLLTKLTMVFPSQEPSLTPDRSGEI